MNIRLLRRLRPYSRLSSSALVGYYLANRMLSQQYFVNHSAYWYGRLVRVMGERLTHRLIGTTLGSMASGGSSAHELAPLANNYLAMNKPFLLRFCAQIVTDPEEEYILDHNAHSYKKSKELAGDNLINITISGLINYNLLEKCNRSVSLIDQIAGRAAQDGLIKGNRLYESFQQFFPHLQENHFQEYLNTVHGHPEHPSQFEVNLLDFKTAHPPFNLFEQHSHDFIVRLMLPLDRQQQYQMARFKQRLLQLTASNVNNNDNSINNVKIVVEEQPSLQKAVDSFTRQLQLRHNTLHCSIISSQSFRQSTLEQHLDFTSKKGLRLGLRMIRADCPQVSTSSTSRKETNIKQNQINQSYLFNLQRVASCNLQGMVLIATCHQQLVALSIQQLKVIKNREISFSFSVEMGMGDYLCEMINRQDNKVVRQIPWAPIPFLLPYLAARAQQIHRAHSSLFQLQSHLLATELKRR